MAKKKMVRKSSGLNDDSKTWAWLAAFLSVLGFILVILSDKKKDKYVMYYAKQSLVVFVALVVIAILNNILIWIPIVGWLVMVVLNIIGFILWLLSWLNALSGEMKETWLVGKFAKEINF